MVVCLDLFRAKTGSLFNLENIWVLGNRNFLKVRAVSDEKYGTLYQLVKLIRRVVYASFSDGKSRLGLRHVRRVINLGNAELAASFPELNLNDLLIN